jgi:hypothetical protein
MLFRKLIAVYSQNNKKFIEHTELLHIEASDKCSYINDKLRVKRSPIFEALV